MAESLFKRVSAIVDNVDCAADLLFLTALFHAFFASCEANVCSRFGEKEKRDKGFTLWDAVRKNTSEIRHICNTSRYRTFAVGK